MKEVKEFIKARPELAGMPYEEVKFLLEDYNNNLLSDTDDIDEANTDWEL